MFYVVFKQLLIMALIVLGGFTFAKAFKVDDKEQKFLSKLLIYFINPFLILNALNIDFEMPPVLNRVKHKTTVYAATLSNVA